MVTFVRFIQYIAYTSVPYFPNLLSGVVGNSVLKVYHSFSGMKYYVIPRATKEKLDLKGKHCISCRLGAHK